MFKFEPSVELPNSAELFKSDYSVNAAAVGGYSSHPRAINMFLVYIYPEPAFVCHDGVTQFDFFS